MVKIVVHRIVSFVELIQPMFDLRRNVLVLPSLGQLPLHCPAGSSLKGWEGRDGLGWLDPIFDMSFKNFTDDLSHSVIYHLIYLIGRFLSSDWLKERV